MTLTMLAAGEAVATTPEGKAGSVVFIRDAAPAFGDVYLMDAKGGVQTPLTTSGDAAGDQHPAFSANGRQIFFSRGDASGTDIFVINRNGSGLANVTNTPLPDRESLPEPSPDGKKLAYTRTVPGNNDIWVSNIDGSGAVNLTNTPADDETGASFSPDGRLIAFSLCPDGGGPCAIRIMNADGSAPRTLTNPLGGANDFIPSFSRDSTSVAFKRSGGGINDVFLINVDGSGERNVTMNAATVDEVLLSFTADGAAIGYAGCPPPCDLLTTPIGGGPATNLTNTPAPFSEGHPDFESVQRCGKSRATIVGDDGPDKIKGTKKKDVIVGNDGKNKVKARGGNDIICAGKKAVISCGGGNDKIVGKFKSAKGCERGKGLD